jgi:peroxin-4
VCSWDTSGCRGTRPAGCVFWWTERSFCVLFSRIFNLHFHSSQLSKVCEQKKPNTKEALSVGASPHSASAAVEWKLQALAHTRKHMPCPRLLKEYREVKTAKQDPEIQLDLTDETDIFQWKAHIQGPKDSPYEGGTFELSLRCPETYPLAPPKVLFVTPVFHPNVLFKTGEICLDILKPDAWTPAWTLQSVCRAVVALLSHPEADSPLCVRAFECYVPALVLLHTRSRDPFLLCVCTATATAATSSAMATCGATDRWRKCTRRCMPRPRGQKEPELSCCEWSHGGRTIP